VRESAPPAPRSRCTITASVDPTQWFSATFATTIEGLAAIAAASIGLIGLRGRVRSRGNAVVYVVLVVSLW
jgi:hypothetical protein